MSKPQKFGFGSMVLLGINGVLGTGIFLMPGQVMALVGPSSMFVYLAVSIAALAIAFCFAECASLFSRNGAAYVYAKEAFGEFVGFEVGIMKWSASIIAWAALAAGFVTILSQIFPSLAEGYMRSLFLVFFLGSLGILNIFGIEMIRFLNNMITIGKIVPLLVFIVFGFMFIETENFTPFFPEYLEANAYGSAALLIFFAFSGFEALAVAAEDMENPRKNIPLALIAILLITSVIYFLVQAVIIGVLGADLANNEIAIAAAAVKMVGPIGGWVVMACMLVASGGINIASSFISPRSGVALAQDGMVPMVIATNGKYGTPVISIAITTILAIVISVSGSFVTLATISVITRFSQYFPTCLAVMAFRKNRPDLISSFPRVLGPVIPLFAMSCILLVLFSAPFTELMFGSMGFFLGVPCYFIRKYYNREKAELTPEVEALVDSV